MTIEEMHVTFRELGQQMGIQTTRAIFSENIDICLNFAIDAKARSIIHQNVGMSFSDKVQRDNAKVSPINGLYTLYRQSKIDISKIDGAGSMVNPFVAIINTKDMYLLTGCDCQYDPLHIAHCRLVEREELYNTLTDYCNRPTKRNPIACITGDYTTGLIISIYVDDVKYPNSIIYTYIKKPAVVKLDEIDNSKNVDCDLPEYLHKDIVTDAINYYLQSLGSTTGGTPNQ